MVKNKKPLAKQVYPVPEKIDKQIAKEKLAAMGTRIDRLTPEQKKYLASWTIGT
jgi:adenosylhomocysteinase